MAIVKLGAAVVGIRGTVGGLTYSANKSGPYARVWSKGSNPRSPKQSVSRQRVSRMPELWRALTAGQRSDWNDYAAEPEQELTNSLGESYYTGGYQWFLHCSTTLLLCGQATGEDAPTIAVPAAPVVNYLNYGKVAGNFWFQLGTNVHTYDPFSTLVQARAVPASGRIVNYSGWRHLKFAWGQAGDQWGPYLTTQHAAIWGVPTYGWRLWIRTRDLTTEGRLGPWASATTSYVDL